MTSEKKNPSSDKGNTSKSDEQQGSGGRRRLLIVVASVAGAVLLAAGAAFAVYSITADDTADETTPTSTNLLAQLCPLEVVMSDSGVETYGDPVEDAWDATEVVGKSLGEAETMAKEHGCEIQVSVQDGQGIPVSLGLFPNRVLVWTEDNIVTTVEQVG